MLKSSLWVTAELIYDDDDDDDDCPLSESDHHLILTTPSCAWWRPAWPRCGRRETCWPPISWRRTPARTSSLPGPALNGQSLSVSQLQLRSDRRCCYRDEAVEAKNNSEVELAKNRIELLQVNSQLLETVEHKVKLSQDLEEVEVNMVSQIQEQVQDKLTRAEGESSSESSSDSEGGREKLARKLSRIIFGKWSSVMFWSVKAVILLYHVPHHHNTNIYTSYHYNQNISLKYKLNQMVELTPYYL